MVMHVSGVTMGDKQQWGDNICTTLSYLHCRFTDGEKERDAWSLEFVWKCHYSKMMELDGLLGRIKKRVASG